MDKQSFQVTLWKHISRLKDKHGWVLVCLFLVLFFTDKIQNLSHDKGFFC